MPIVLYQFEFSHFNDKARWALDWKGVPHERRSLLPGLHAPTIQRLSGQSQTPVLDVEGEIVAGSAAIIDRLEKNHPEPALYPADPAARKEALALQARFDDELGPSTRTVVFSRLIDEGGYVCAMFARKASPVARVLYRATFPFARGLIAKGNGVNPANIERCFAVVDDWLEEIAKRTEATGYLVGDTFSVADLAGAALLAPLANPTHPDMARPTPVPASVQDLLARYADHAAIHWTTEIYARHR